VIKMEFEESHECKCPYCNETVNVVIKNIKKEVSLEKQKSL